MLTRLDDYRDTVTQAEASFRMLKANLDVIRKAYLQSVRTVKADPTGPGWISKPFRCSPPLRRRP